ncbi:MAG: hypothetical protein K2X57_06670 [Xanthobacteraceae bacterium]|nr:hypothetical protein [Xanthobacteraceae bacterium]
MLDTYSYSHTFDRSRVMSEMGDFDDADWETIGETDGTVRLDESLDRSHEEDLMDIELLLDRRGAARAGVDYSALAANLQAEIDKLAKREGVTAGPPLEQGPPDGAQGDPALIHWLVHLATEPAMAKAYASALIFALNEIVAAIRPKNASGTAIAEDDKSDNAPAHLSVRIKKLGNDVVLPTTTAAIQAFLENLGAS